MNSFRVFGGGFCFAGLVVTLVLYLSLNLSPSREDKSGHAFRAWRKFGMPLILLNLLLLGTSIFYSVIFFSWYMVAISPDWDRSKGLYMYIQMHYILGSMTSLGGVVGISALSVSVRAHRSAVRKAAEHTGTEAGAPSDGLTAAQL